MISIFCLFFLSYLSIKTFWIASTLFCAINHRKRQMSRIKGYFFLETQHFLKCSKKLMPVQSETFLCWDEKKSIFIIFAGIYDASDVYIYLRYIYGFTNMKVYTKSFRLWIFGTPYNNISLLLLPCKLCDFG